MSAAEFQSSPGANTGCDVGPWPDGRQGIQGFNPHPVRTPGATATRGWAWTQMPWFQSSPGANTGCDCERRPDGSRLRRFNPHPVRTPGATPRPTGRAARDACFNPHPVRTPGATPAGRLGVSLERVSILTRCEHRVRLCRRAQRRTRCSRFNPHPVRTPGATPRRVRPRRASPCFNPHPVRTPGATSSHRSSWSGEWFQSSPGANTGCDRCHRRRWQTGRSGFNPHPVRTPGATRSRPPSGWC